MSLKPILCLLISITTAFHTAEGKHGRNHGKSGHHLHSKEYMDLGYSFSKDTIYFPGQKEFSLNKDYDGVNKTGFWYSAFSFCMGEHGGTHIDAPFHFNKEGWTLDQIPASHLIAIHATVIDVEDAVSKAESPAQFVVQVGHLIQHEEKYGSIPLGGVVLVHTGWSKYWPDKMRYLGWDNSTQNASSNVNFPGISLDAAKWLADERQIVGVGIDTPSVDPGNAQTFPVHVEFASKKIYNIENVANLHVVIQRVKTDNECELHLFIMPIKIIGGTGAPTRILAFCA